jgi:hypothetical protein
MVGRPAERDGTHPGAVRGIPVDRTLAVSTARSSRHNPESSTALALLGRPQDRNKPLTCGAKGTRTPGLLDANQTLFQLSYSPGTAFAKGTWYE